MENQRAGDNRGRATTAAAGRGDVRWRPVVLGRFGAVAAQVAGVVRRGEGEGAGLVGV